MSPRKFVFRWAPKATGAPPPSAGEKPFHPLYGVMKGLIRIVPGADLTQPADLEWADSLDAQCGPEKREK
ncbi:MAG TPA: hypothetical protein VK430_00250 [Xanthobacteraceae bacterium]|nr:hypothetical protein [Xanthobacteraceae bacterium]